MAIISDYDAVEEVFNGRDNIIEWVVSEDGDPVTDLSDTSRIVICVGSDTADSDVLGSNVIWWTDSVTDKELPDGTLFTGDVVRAKLGQASLTAGVFTNCRMLLFDTESTNGAVISKSIKITVHAPCI